MNTRRQFLIRAPIALLGAAAACRNQQSGAPATQSTPGAPATFGSAPGVGPEVTASTFAEAEKLVQVTMTAPEREMAAATWRRTMGPRATDSCAAKMPARRSRPTTLTSRTRL